MTRRPSPLHVTIGTLALLAAALTGCGSDQPTSAGSPTPTPTPTASTSSTPPAPPTSAAPSVDLKTACPEVEAALPGGAIPEYTDMMTFVDTLEGLYDNGDTETKNAINLLLEPTYDLETDIQYKTKGSELTTALSAWITGISSFADRCKAAGSSALQ